MCNRKTHDDALRTWANETHGADVVSRISRASCGVTYGLGNGGPWCGNCERAFDNTFDPCDCDDKSDRVPGFDEACDLLASLNIGELWVDGDCVCDREPEAWFDADAESDPECDCTSDECDADHTVTKGAWVEPYWEDIAHYSAKEARHVIFGEIANYL